MSSGSVQPAAQPVSQADDQARHDAWTMDVADLLTLVQVGPDRYRAHVSQPNYQVAIFGGQMLGQSLSAATAHAGAGQRVHSLHGYFLSAGRPDLPIDYVVDTLRASAVSGMMQVTAEQEGQQLFAMHCFFRADQPGFDHQVAPPPVNGPEGLEDFAAIARADPAAMGDFGRFVLHGTAIEVRPIARDDLRHEPGATRRRLWFRVPSAAGVDDPAMQAAMLAYLSDYWFARVALVPHCKPVPDKALKFASIDHGMWFHRSARVDDWLLYDTETPSASDGTGYVRGLIYDRGGRLVASTAQEVLQVPRRKT